MSKFIFYALNNTKFLWLFYYFLLSFPYSSIDLKVSFSGKIFKSELFRIYTFWSSLNSKAAFLTVSLSLFPSILSVFGCVYIFFFRCVLVFRICYSYNTEEIIADCSNLALYMYTLWRCCMIFFKKNENCILNLYIEAYECIPIYCMVCGWYQC